MCNVFMLVGEGGGGVPLQILIPLNFMNIAKRRSFIATLQASDVQQPPA